ncbi:MAG: hypothetical protein Q8Q42_00730 [Nanoarchaeota archaeon]|nr:hypothetical protein [Nanoarchaeota archaeon]
MPVCGFNQKMLEGLTAFSEGLVEHGLFHRGEQNGETLEQGIRRELSDMVRLLPELNRIDDVAKREMTEGVVKYALGFYMNMRKNGVEGGLRDYKEVIGRVMGYFQEMDSKYYGELEGRPEDMRELTEHLNFKQI